MADLHSCHHKSSALTLISMRERVSRPIKMLYMQSSVELYSLGKLFSYRIGDADFQDRDLQCTQTQRSAILTWNVL